MWRQNRPGCLDQYGQVTCVPPGLDQSASRVGLAAGVLVALLVVTLRGRVLVAARGGAVAILTWGTALWGADALEAGRPKALVCVLRQGTGQRYCEYPPWRLHDMYVSGAVGVVLGLLVVVGEATSRRAPDVPRLGWRRVLVATLMTGAVPLGVYGLLLLAADGGPKERWAAPRCVAAAVLALALGQLMRTVDGRGRSPALRQA
jgi:hypothetical protein